jgi:hypothetical protein
VGTGVVAAYGDDHLPIAANHVGGHVVALLFAGLDGGLGDGLDRRGLGGSSDHHEMCRGLSPDFGVAPLFLRVG